MKELKEIDLHLKNYENSGEFRDAIQVVAAAERLIARLKAGDLGEVKALNHSLWPTRMVTGTQFILDGMHELAGKRGWLYFIPEEEES